MVDRNASYQELHSAVNQLKEDIVNKRDEYKSLVSELYKQKPFLFKGKDSEDDDVLTDEIKEYYELIGHCLLIGDSDVLYEFGIKPFTRDISTLARPHSLDTYVKVFERRRDADSTEEGMKFYLAMLIRAFQGACGEDLSSQIPNVDAIRAVDE